MLCLINTNQYNHRAVSNNEETQRRALPRQCAGSSPTGDLETLGRLSLASCSPGRPSQGSAARGGWADRSGNRRPSADYQPKGRPMAQAVLELGLRLPTKDAPRPGRKPATAVLTEGGGGSSDEAIQTV